MKVSHDVLRACQLGCEAIALGKRQWKLFSTFLDVVLVFCPFTVLTDGTSDGIYQKETFAYLHVGRRCFQQNRRRSEVFVHHVELSPIHFESTYEKSLKVRGRLFRIWRSYRLSKGSLCHLSFGQCDIVWLQTVIYSGSYHLYRLESCQLKHLPLSSPTGRTQLGRPS